MGTTAAVAAVTGRPNSEGATTPLTSTAMMMGGFNAISHARVRSIDLGEVQIGNVFRIRTDSCILAYAHLFALTVKHSNTSTCAETHI